MASKIYAFFRRLFVDFMFISFAFMLSLNSTIKKTEHISTQTFHASDAFFDSIIQLSPQIKKDFPDVLVHAK